MNNESHIAKHVVTSVLHSFIRIGDDDFDGWMTRPDGESEDVLLLLKPGSAKLQVGETLAVSTIARIVPVRGSHVVIARIN
ncbi:MAG: hypothetical protein IPG59_11695 [Candidatus Melainabacteria bacterium]|nr:MAG: hypothetical protein IPG59_11695 [Candidatus Melainabacteria bacterium]